VGFVFQTPPQASRKPVWCFWQTTGGHS
jgi:hypothetical protein